MAKYAKVTGVTTNLSVRPSPGSTSLLFSIYNDEVVQVLQDPSNGWMKIRHKKGDGYVSTTYMTGVYNTTGTLATITNVTNSVNIRSGPSSTNANYVIYFTLTNGATIRVLETFKTWKIIEHDGRIGCVHPDYVSDGSAGGESGVAFNGARVIAGGTNCYDRMGTDYTFVTHAGGEYLDLIDEDDFNWLIHWCPIVAPGQPVMRRFLQRKNVDTSYCNNNSRTAVFGSGYIQSGTSNGKVFHLQWYLKYWYSDVPVTGTVDATTLQRIKDFQGRVGLTKDGIVGNDTKDALIYYRRRSLP